MTIGHTIYEDTDGRIYLRTDDPTGTQSVRLYDRAHNVGIGWISRTLALHGNPNISADQLTPWVTWIEQHREAIINNLTLVGRDVIAGIPVSVVSDDVAHPYWPNWPESQCI